MMQCSRRRSTERKSRTKRRHPSGNQTGISFVQQVVVIRFTRKLTVVEQVVVIWFCFRGFGFFRADSVPDALDAEGFGTDIEIQFKPALSPKPAVPLKPALPFKPILPF